MRYLQIGLILMLGLDVFEVNSLNIKAFILTVFDVIICGLKCMAQRAGRTKVQAWRKSLLLCAMRHAPCLYFSAPCKNGYPIIQNTSNN